MDLSVIISSLISGGVAILVCVLNNRQSQRKHDADQDKKMLEMNAKFEQSLAVISCKIDELDRKQAIHNSVIERVYKLENRADVQDAKVKITEDRISTVEKKVEK